MKGDIVLYKVGRLAQDKLKAVIEKTVEILRS